MWPGLSAKMSASRKAHADEYSLICFPPASLSPEWIIAASTAPLSASPRDPLRLAGRSGPGSYQIIAFWGAGGPGACEISLTLLERSLYSPPPTPTPLCGTPAIKTHWPSRPNVLQIPPCNARCLGWGAWGGLRALALLGELLWYNYSPVCGSLTQGMWNLIIIMVVSVPLLSSYCGFFFMSLNVEYLFW